MSLQNDPARSGNMLLRALVVIAIVLIAVWAASGGLDQIGGSIDGPSPTTTVSD